jgi:hypothetical protein
MSPTAGMRDTSPTPERSGFYCQMCGRFNVTAVTGLFQRPRAGSPQRFCDHACRQAAYRRRRAGLKEDTPLQLTGGRSRRLTTPADTTITNPQTTRCDNKEAV